MTMATFRHFLYLQCLWPTSLGSCYFSKSSSKAITKLWSIFVSNTQLEHRPPNKLHSWLKSDIDCSISKVMISLQSYKILHPITHPTFHLMAKTLFQEWHFYSVERDTASDRKVQILIVFLFLAVLGQQKLQTPINDTLQICQMANEECFQR